jgi:predicted Zn-dependent protease
MDAPLDDLHNITETFRRRAPDVERWSLRLVDERRQSLSVRQDVLLPVGERRTTGAMITVIDGGGMGYGASSDLSPRGMLRAAERARSWARATAHLALLDTDKLPVPTQTGSYRTSVERGWNEWSLEEKIHLLHDASRVLKRSERIVDWQASLIHCESRTLLVSSAGGHIQQTFAYISPSLRVVANRGAQTQERSYNGMQLARQGGLEQLGKIGFPAAAERIVEEALVLLDAANCPSGCMDLLLLPSQMTLQIHESIGHPLELDRILGDERNYAGTSFVTLDMFGSYRYGSELLNVTYDPTRPEQIASYAFDDEGTPSQRQFIIRAGILERPLGGTCSQLRAGLDGVANARSSGWNRPPIDRMANLNLESGDAPLQELVGSIERGVLMDTNRSWSIDDSRNKFQFGCEYARLIHDGELGAVVKNPSYRGISARFWRSLSRVGDASTFQVLGVSNCGKGEPNQAIHVGHASPACVFRDVDVFGGA